MGESEESNKGEIIYCLGLGYRYLNWSRLGKKKKKNDYSTQMIKLKEKAWCWPSKAKPGNMYVINIFPLSL